MAHHHTIGPSRAELWQFPIRLTQAVGLGEPEKIVRELHDLAWVFDDMFDLVGYIAPIVEQVFALADKPAPRLPKELEEALDGLAFESCGASANWLALGKTMPKQGLFLWATRLCASEDTVYIGFDASLDLLSDYVIAEPPDDPSKPIIAEMARALVLSLPGWENDIAEVLPLLASSHAVTGTEKEAVRCLESRLNPVTKEEAEDIDRMVDSWHEWHGTPCKWAIEEGGANSAQILGGKRASEAEKKAICLLSDLAAVIERHARCAKRAP